MFFKETDKTKGGNMSNVISLSARIDPEVEIENSEIGDGSWVRYNATKLVNCKLGKNVTVGSGTVLINVIVGDDTRIGMNSIIFGSEEHPVVIGKGCHIVAFCHLNGASAPLVIGNNVGISTGCRITTDSGSVFSEKLAKIFPVTKASVTIKDDVWLAMGVTVLLGVTIESCCVVGAHSLVAKDVPAGVLVAGVPASVRKELDFGDK